MHKKMLFTISVTFVGLVGLFHVVALNILDGGFIELERRGAYPKVERARDPLAHELSTLNGRAGDWADWGDAYAFIEDANPDYSPDESHRYGLHPEAEFARVKVELERVRIGD
jgi:sensor domain CHASE-containing protein